MQKEIKELNKLTIERLKKKEYKIYKEKHEKQKQKIEEDEDEDEDEDLPVIDFVNTFL